MVIWLWIHTNGTTNIFSVLCFFPCVRLWAISRQPFACSWYNKGWHREWGWWRRWGRQWRWWMWLDRCGSTGPVLPPRPSATLQYNVPVQWHCTILYFVTPCTSVPVHHALPCFIFSVHWKLGAGQHFGFLAQRDDFNVFMSNISFNWSSLCGFEWQKFGPFSPGCCPTNDDPTRRQIRLNKQSNAAGPDGRWLSQLNHLLVSWSPNDANSCKPQYLAVQSLHTVSCAQCNDAHIVPQCTHCKCWWGSQILRWHWIAILVAWGYRGSPVLVFNQTLHNVKLSFL